MASADPRVSNCRRCQYYHLQGRRGGHCNKLNVGVRGNWVACSLAAPVFSASLETASLEILHLGHLLPDTRLPEGESLPDIVIVERLERVALEQPMPIDR
jgi:hypothetical protein